MRLFLAFVGFFILILDPVSGISGARDGIELCIRTVIPSLFPFFFLSVLLTNSISGRNIPWLNPLGRFLKIPEGSESLMLIGLLGGYPVGAQAVAQAFHSGTLDRANARRMLGFCSNAGPSFLFGILGTMFSSPRIPWILWLIHIVSAILTGMVLPPVERTNIHLAPADSLSLSKALERAIHIMASVCSWVVLFRVLLCVLERWLLWLLPDVGKIIICGVTELTNGCCMLNQVPSEALRFVMSSCFLSCGGLCVAMQTVSVTAQLGTGLYFPGKLLQTAASFLISCALVPVLFPQSTDLAIPPFITAAVAGAGILTVIFLKKQKNNSSIPLLGGV